MKVFIKGKGHTELTTNDFIAEGGEGKIYGKGNLVYKVYHDPKKMIPVAKIADLSVLANNPAILNPEDILLNSKNTPIGYTMRYIVNTYPLCKLFTKAFRQREQITAENISKLVQKFQQTIAYIHSKQILVVDLNEMNFLVDKKTHQDIYFIDVDSYQTPNFPATALMESVRDRHSTHFSPLTDWFSFAVVSFQLFIGIHPYKGKHPKIHDLETRMQHNISVLNPEVSIPAICYPLNSIPKMYLDWYLQVFEKGQRLAPPTTTTQQPYTTTTKKVHQQHITTPLLFDITELKSVYDSDIINYFHSANNTIVVTENESIYLNNNRQPLTVKNPLIGFTPKMNRPMVAYEKDNLIHIADLIAQQDSIYQCSGQAIMTYDNRLYIQNATSILEVLFHESTKTLVTLRPVANILEKATQVFPSGMAIQNLLGSYYISLFLNTAQHQQIAVKELNGYKILDAKFENNVMMVIASKNGKYNRFVLRFDSNNHYDIRQIPDITYTGLNFTALKTGVCVCLNEEEQMEIFSTKKDHNNIVIIETKEDIIIDSSIKLFNQDNLVLFAKGNKLFTLKMKK